MRAIFLTSALLWAVVVGAGLAIHGCYAEPDDLVYYDDGPPEAKNPAACHGYCLRSGCIDVEFIERESCTCKCSANETFYPAAAPIRTQHDCLTYCETFGHEHHGWDSTESRCYCLSVMAKTAPPDVDVPGDWVPTSIDISNEGDCDLLCEVLGYDRSFYEPSADQCYCFEEDEG